VRPTSPFQFERTRPIRFAVYRMAKLALRTRVLEVGTGEGPVASEMAARTGRQILALDVNAPATVPEGVRFCLGDGQALPFASAGLDAVAFHFALLWMADPAAALREASRVLRRGGVVMVLAEPDLTRRRDDPDTGLGRILAGAVRRTGGHPDAGARVGRWLEEAGLNPHVTETPAQWVGIDDPREVESEIGFLEALGVLDRRSAERLAAAEAAAAGARRVVVPLTYGWAGKP